MPKTADSANLPARLEECFKDSEFIDLSPTVASGMHGWQEHPDVLVAHDSRSHEKHGYYLQTLIMPEHTGSHVDAPAHVLEDRMDRTIETFPVSKLFGRGKCVDASGLALGPGEYLTLDSFSRLCTEQDIAIEKDDIILVRFDWDRFLTDPDFNEPSPWSWWGGNQPGFSEELCEFLYKRNISAVGTDTAACDASVKDGTMLSCFGHDTWFLPNDILIIEGLVNLIELPSNFYFIAVPLKLHRGSGSPIRAIGVTGSRPQ